jgi:WXG100 family type VII secretion target
VKGDTVAEFALDPAALQQAQDLVARIAADLVAERRSLAGTVDGLLGGGWSGVAADEYRQAWNEWRDGADQVLAALHASSELMGQTRAAYLSGDDASVATTAPLQARLQERLS